MNDTELKAGFLALSAELTGFPELRLKASGQGDAYYAALVSAIGPNNVQRLISAFHKAQMQAGSDAAALERELRTHVMSDEALGPVARNIIKLWYVGTWYRLPDDWTEKFGDRHSADDHVVSPTAYTEGLLWPAVGANPPGAKPFGYAMWAQPPRVTLD